VADSEDEDLRDLDDMDGDLLSSGSSDDEDNDVTFDGGYRWLFVLRTRAHCTEPAGKFSACALWNMHTLIPKNVNMLARHGRVNVRHGCNNSTYGQA
jgi:hypothetical protein